MRKMNSSGKVSIMRMHTAIKMEVLASTEGKTFKLGNSRNLTTKSKTASILNMEASNQHKPTTKTCRTME